MTPARYPRGLVPPGRDNRGDAMNDLVCPIWFVPPIVMAFVLVVTIVTLFPSAVLASGITSIPNAAPAGGRTTLHDVSCIGRVANPRMCCPTPWFGVPAPRSYRAPNLL